MLLSWFKKRKLRTKASDDAETIEEVDSQQQTTQKHTNPKKKIKAATAIEMVSVCTYF
jgi:hypothetical protein